jgi:hypothetical protein
VHCSTVNTRDIELSKQGNHTISGYQAYLNWPKMHVRLIGFLGLVRAALLCFLSLPVSPIFPALRDLSQNLDRAVESE